MSLLHDDDPALAARVAAAAALRRLGHAMVSHEAEPALLERIAKEAEATAAVVEAGPRRQRPVAKMKRQLWESAPPDSGPMAHFVECMVSGPANPMGIAMQVRREGERAVAQVTFGAAFEGAPNRAHGGAVAAVMDDIMGYVLAIQSTPAYTGHMGISYLAPTPVAEPLIATAWMEHRDGRKLTMAGTLTGADDQLIAKADGLFIAVPPERFGES